MSLLWGVVKLFSHPTTQFKVRIIELQVSLLDYQIGFSTSWPTASTLKILFDSLGGRPVILYFSAVFTWTNLLVVVAELDGGENEALDLVPLVTNCVLEVILSFSQLQN